MSKPRDTEIKLFGRTITSLVDVSNYDPSPLSPNVQSKEASSSSSSSCSPSIGPDRVLVDKTEQENSRFKDPYILPHLNEPPKAASEILSPRSSKTNTDQQSEITTTSTSAATDEPTTLKKPDKILPCPRCESTNTKFCYYNNYNVSQPRYFCRNCQRYWTAGGSMRNVPVGSGRRKNKGWAASNHYLQVTSEDYENNNHSGTILSFGSSESTLTETGKNQPGDAKITADSASQEHKTNQGLLPPQVKFPNNSSPWPYQWSPTAPNANCYPIPFYWGCMVPVWPTSETSPCLGKRSRDQTEGGGMKDASTIPRARLISEATNSAVWSTKPERRTEGISLFNGFETKGSNRRSLAPETSINLQANPAAMSRSMNFRESMQE
ncbi:unnamed protein product [Eruca vesicaria subsp. sativa]|uniref:Dof-type domain-containing protein n=1 Tax=Eruca vesicaria subsp. sativa TaxID=29727 RepID=A0ABC8L431_ERUVS|nr:unnamed protein product [Eruca vesicaria subsp. sativa]